MYNCIKLNKKEKILFDQIHLHPNDNHELQRASIEPMFNLTNNLLKRRAIPTIRLRYFTDPQLNIGVSISRREVFQKHININSDEDIMRHPNFWKYLCYFVEGPDLPDDVINAFVKKLLSCGIVTSGDIMPLCELARQEVRNHRLERKKAAEEFYKLALELDLEYEARSIRDAVMQLGTTYDKKIKR